MAPATNKAVREFFRNYGKIRTALLFWTPPAAGRGGCGSTVLEGSAVSKHKKMPGITFADRIILLRKEASRRETFFVFVAACLEDYTRMTEIRRYAEWFFFFCARDSTPWPGWPLAWAA